MAEELCNRRNIGTIGHHNRCGRVSCDVSSLPRQAGPIEKPMPFGHIKSWAQRQPLRGVKTKVVRRPSNAQCQTSAMHPEHFRP